MTDSHICARVRDISRDEV